ncbi:hypothetical protein [Agreia sp. COWG]|uniref:hypothetical protein n=1 Tax=Agreia sp. COWG TaxID=2773266 RepID=UPI0019295402|nr:hypothetical protein [Agreia sp. COWG]CAD6016005.1 conserved exported protein of unknown function [Agreia sp. COWG]
MKVFGGAVVALLALLAFVAILGAGGGWASAAAACGTSSGGAKPAVTTLPASVGAWSGDQLSMAATLMNVAAEMGVNQQAQTILIMTAMGESTLSNPDHGDAVDNSTIGVLQQGDSYGPRSARLDPPTAARAFLTRLLGVENWEGLEPTLAAHKVQINADPYHYAPYWDDAQAVVKALSGAAVTSGCGTVAGDAKELASTLVAARNDGRLTSYEPAMLDELNGIADGTASDNCQIDTRILQVMVIVLNKYGSLSVSDLNRPCVGMDLHCGYSAHCTKPAAAVDFTGVGGVTTIGSDQASIDLVAFLDPILPKGSHAGQVECRPTVSYVNITEFDDPCTHQHIDVAGTKDPLNVAAVG